MQRNIYISLSMFFCAWPSWAFAAINTFYDLKLKITEIKDKIAAFKEAVATSPIYGILLYSGTAILIFIIAITIILFLISMLKK